MTEARFCSNCGAQRRPRARFCPSCGQSFEKMEAEALESQMPAAAEPPETSLGQAPMIQLSSPTMAPPRIGVGSLLLGGDSAPHVVSGVSGALIGAALGGAFKSVFFGGIPPFLELGDARSFRFVFVPILGACVLGAITGLWSVIFAGGRGGVIPLWAASAAVAGVFFAYLLLGLPFRQIPLVFRSGVFAIGFVLSALFAAAFAVGTSWPWWKRLTGRA